MTTYSRYTGAGRKGYPTDSGRQPYTVEAIIDFSTTGNTNVAADVFNVAVIPAGTIVLAAGTEVLVADTAGHSGTVLLKVGSTSQGPATAPTPAGLLAAASAQTAVAPAASDTYLSATIGTGAINAKCRFYAVCVPVMARAGTPVTTGSGTYTTQATTDSFVNQLT